MARLRLASVTTETFNRLFTPFVRQPSHRPPLAGVTRSLARAIAERSRWPCECRWQRLLIRAAARAQIVEDRLVAVPEGRQVVLVAADVGRLAVGIGRRR